MPVGILNVALDERHSQSNNVVADHLGEKANTGTSGLGNVPLVLVGVLIPLVRIASAPSFPSPSPSSNSISSTLPLADTSTSHS